ncbi:MAG: hypothetical protein NTZ38_03010 [Candidatus Taylorbacteria bacterium]|nr:hypothetical protein [Candidatus Taylorbacteria bacterium]
MKILLQIVKLPRRFWAAETKFMGRWMSLPVQVFAGLGIGLIIASLGYLWVANDMVKEAYTRDIIVVEHDSVHESL